MKRQEWINRCAERLISLAHISRKLAVDIAESQLENLNNDLNENPEEAADDEISYWTAD